MELIDTRPQHNPKAKPFRKRGFPLYDDISAIIGDTVATGADVFSIGGVSSSASPDIDDTRNQIGRPDDDKGTDDEQSSDEVRVQT